MKSVLAFVLLGAAHLVHATPLPDPGLLRIPRIYNALVTTDAKLQPSRASPYTVPIVPVIGAPHPPPAPPPPPPPPSQEEGRAEHHHNRKAHKDDAGLPEVDATHADTPDVGEMAKPGAKMMYPLTFYPRSIGYYSYPYLPYAYPFGPQSYGYDQYHGGVGLQQPGGYSGVDGGGFGVGNGFGQFGPFGSGPGGLPMNFNIEESSSIHITAGSKVGGSDATPGTGNSDENSSQDSVASTEETEETSEESEE